MMKDYFSKNVNEPTVSLTVRVPYSYKEKLLEKANSLELTMSDLVWNMLYRSENNATTEIFSDELANMVVENAENPKKIRLIEKTTKINNLIYLVFTFLLVNATIFTLFYFNVIEKTTTQTLFIFFLAFFAGNSLTNAFAKDKTE